jgi:hypothetical protein
MSEKARTRLEIPKQTSLAAMLATVPGKPPKKKHDWGKRIEAQLGYAPGPELRDLVEWAGNRSGGLGVGHVFLESEWPASTADPKKWEAEFFGTTISPLLEAFTETVCIGQARHRRGGSTSSTNGETRGRAATAGSPGLDGDTARGTIAPCRPKSGSSRQSFAELDLCDRLPEDRIANGSIHPAGYWS